MCALHLAEVSYRVKEFQLNFLRTDVFGNGHSFSFPICFGVLTLAKSYKQKIAWKVSSYFMAV